jgi:hypothetical protein
MLMKVYSLLTAAGMVVGAFAPSSLAQAPQAAGNSAFAGHIDIDKEIDASMAKAGDRPQRGAEYSSDPDRRRGI